MFGYKQDDLLGQTLDILLPASLRIRHSQHLTNFMSRARPCCRRPMGTPLQIRGVQKSGRLLPIDIQIDVLRADDQTFGVAFVRRMAFPQLSRSVGRCETTRRHRSPLSNSKRLSRSRGAQETAWRSFWCDCKLPCFTHACHWQRTTSHDIRTALNAIQVSTSMLREDSKGLSTEQLEHLDILEGERVCGDLSPDLAWCPAGASHMRSIITNVLDLSKIQSGKMEFE